MEYRILGPVEVGDGNRPVPLPSSLLALLALLLLNANEVVATDRLLDELWGEKQPASSAAALHVRVSQLRKALGPAAGRLRTQPPGYVLDVQPRELDLDRFVRLVEESLEAEPAAAAAALREALDLWRGPALANVAYEEFAQRAIRRLDELREGALERRIDADLALGRHLELIPELEGIVAAHALRERPREQLMLALYRSGRQVEALEAYGAARETLLHELGIEPGPELRRLEQAILRHDPSLGSFPTAPRLRSVLVVASAEGRLDALLSVAVPLATAPPKEIILARVVEEAGDLRPASAQLEARRAALAAAGSAARSAAFVSSGRNDDLARFADEQAVDLILTDGTSETLQSARLDALLTTALCDVAILFGDPVERGTGPVLVPFVGAEHDWAAIEIAAWAAGALQLPVWLAGPRTGHDERDSSRLLANASLAVQRTLGVSAEPLLLEPSGDALIEASAGATLVVVGVSDRWRAEGLGKARGSLIERGHPPLLLVRSGLRPSGLAPEASLTRFTWTLKS